MAGASFLFYGFYSRFPQTRLPLWKAGYGSPDHQNPNRNFYCAGGEYMDQKQNEKIPKKQAQAFAKIMRQEGKGEIPSDVNGSYTGTPIDGGVPVQDADDL